MVRGGYIGSRGDGPNVGLVGEANQRRCRVQRDKKMVWERPGVCVCASECVCDCVVVVAQQGRG